MELNKIKNYQQIIFYFALEKNRILQPLRLVKMYVSLFCYFTSCYSQRMSLHAIFLWCIEETHSNISTRVNQKKIKSSWKEYVSSTCVKYLPLKNIFKKKKKNNRSLIMANYKLIKNNCCLRVFIQKRYHTFLDKISILTWRLLVISSQNFSCELNSFRTFSLRIISYILLQL